MEYLTIKEVCEKWGLGNRIVTLYCSEGRIKGATKKGNLWLIPKDAPKPDDLGVMDLGTGAFIMRPSSNLMQKPGDVSVFLQKRRKVKKKEEFSKRFSFFTAQRRVTTKLVDDWINLKRGLKNE